MTMDMTNDDSILDNGSVYKMRAAITRVIGRGGCTSLGRCYLQAKLWWFQVDVCEGYTESLPVQPRQ